MTKCRLVMLTVCLVISLCSPVTTKKKNNGSGEGGSSNMSKEKRCPCYDFQSLLTHMGTLDNKLDLMNGTLDSIMGIGTSTLQRLDSLETTTTSIAGTAQSILSQLSGVSQAVTTATNGMVGKLDDVANALQPLTLTVDEMSSKLADLSERITLLQLGVCGDLVADIVFVLDASGSVRSDNFFKTVDMVTDFVRSFDISDNKVRVGLVTYDHNTHVAFHLDTYSNKDDVLNALGNIVYTEGATHTHKALDLLVDELFNGNGNRPNVKDVVIFLTDGVSIDEYLTLAAAQRVHAENYLVFSLGIGSNLRENELDAIASDPDSTYSMRAATFDDVANIPQIIKDTLCQDQASA